MDIINLRKKSEAAKVLVAVLKLLYEMKQDLEPLEAVNDNKNPNKGGHHDA